MAGEQGSAWAWEGQWSGLGSGSMSQSSKDLAFRSSGQIMKYGPQRIWSSCCPTHLETVESYLQVEG